MLTFQISESISYPLPSPENPEALLELVKLANDEGIPVACDEPGFNLDGFDAEDLVLIQKTLSLVPEDDQKLVLGWLVGYLPFQIEVFYEYLKEWIETYEVQLLKAVWDAQEDPSLFLKMRTLEGYYQNLLEFAETYIENNCEDEAIRELMLEQNLETVAKRFIISKEFTAFELKSEVVIFV